MHILTSEPAHPPIAGRSGRAGLTALIALVVAGMLATALLTPGASAASVSSAGTAGCGRAPALSSGRHTITSAGLNRTYVLRVPPGYQNDHPYRLIFAQHWLNGTADIVAGGGADGAAWAFYGQQQLAGDSTIFVAPQGIDNGWANSGGRDLTLIDDLRALIENGLCVDTSLIFAMGWSYGGAMSYALACARPAAFRAVVVYSGANLSGCNPGTQPVAYFGIHGTHDSVLNISNGRSLRDTFVRNNGCGAQTPAEPGLNSLRHITTAYSDCRSGFPVQWAAFDGDHVPDPVDGSTTASGTRTWTSAEAWRFLSQFASTTTPTTPPPSTTTPAPTPPGNGNCTVRATVNAWNNGLTANLTLTNTSTSTLNGWRLDFALAGGQQITGGWNAEYRYAGSNVTATSMSYNGVLAPGASTTIGFQASHTGNAAAPTGFVLEGTPCT